MMKNTEGYYHQGEVGLACPPIDDYAMSDAFYYDVLPSMNLDPAKFFADVSEDQEDLSSHKKKPLITRYNGKGKELKRVLQVLEPDMEMVAKVYAELERIRCRLAVEGVTTHKTTYAPPVTKARPKIKLLLKKQVNNVVMQRRSMHKTNNLTQTRRPNMSMPKNEKDFELRLKATKRKLRDSYVQANNLKRHRTTQFIDLQHLPPMQTTNKKSLKKEAVSL